MSAKGFTLLELLVVIVIVVIIAGVGFAVFSQSISKARDNQRKIDLQNIAQALELFYQKNGHYPCANARQTSTDPADAWIKDHCSLPIAYLDRDYIEKLPRDPKSDQGNPVLTAGITGYSYWTPAGGGCPATAGQYFVLAAGLEDIDDPEADRNKGYRYCGGDLISLISSNAYVLIPD